MGHAPIPDPEKIADDILSGRTQVSAFVVQRMDGIRRDMRSNAPLLRLSIYWLVGWWMFSSIVFTIAEGAHVNPIVCQSCLPDGPWINRFGDAVYFTWMNITTVGFGDIAPHTTLSRVLACLNSIVGLGAFGWLVAIAALALTAASGPGKPVETNEAWSARGLRWPVWKRWSSVDDPLTHTAVSADNPDREMLDVGELNGAT